MATVVHTTAGPEADQQRRSELVPGELGPAVDRRPSRSDVLCSVALVASVIATSLALWALIVLAVVEAVRWVF